MEVTPGRRVAAQRLQDRVVQGHAPAGGIGIIRLISRDGTLRAGVLCKL